MDSLPHPGDRARPWAKGLRSLILAYLNGLGTATVAELAAASGKAAGAIGPRLASGLYRRLAQCMRGYADAQARQIFRDLINLPATVTVSAKEVEVSFHRRSHLPILLASGLFEQPVPVPWWGGHTLRLTTYSGPATPPAS